jgi:hypothetical protein
VPQQLQGEYRKLVFVGASPTRGSISIYDLRMTIYERAENMHPVVQLRENIRIDFREMWVRFPSGVANSSTIFMSVRRNASAFELTRKS